jgi:hypothetical protein
MKGTVMENSDNYKDNIMSDQTPTTQLEPRVVKLEAGLDILTKNVTELTTAVRENANNLEGKIERLTVAVTEAQAPKKTDWSIVISAVFLILALGSAIFWPLNQSTQDNKSRLEEYHKEMVDHQKLDMHPVGMALVQRLEDQLKVHVSNNEKEFKNRMDSDIKEAEMTRMHFQTETETVQKLMDSKDSIIDAKIESLRKFHDLDIQRLSEKIQFFENKMEKFQDKDHDELLLWRQKSMRLNNSDFVVPLIPADSSKNQK